MRHCLGCLVRDRVADGRAMESLRKARQRTRRRESLVAVFQFACPAVFPLTR